MPEIKTCPNCLKGDMTVFYQVPRVPVHSVLLMPTRDIAVNFPKGDIALGHCSHCGFIANTLFDPTVHNYSAGIGSRTVNSLPCRRPSLAAVTRPPWHSTKLRTKASPIPSPASARRDDGFA